MDRQDAQTMPNNVAVTGRMGKVNLSLGELLTLYFKSWPLIL